MRELHRLIFFFLLFFIMKAIWLFTQWNRFHGLFIGIKYIAGASHIHCKIISILRFSKLPESRLSIKSVLRIRFKMVNVISRVLYIVFLCILPIQTKHTVVLLLFSSPCNTPLIKRAVQPLPTQLHSPLILIFRYFHNIQYFVRNHSLYAYHMNYEK